jgi:DNA-directed RNA polymerase sigma subunit (sigma70/sigma32)
MDRPIEPTASAAFSTDLQTVKESPRRLIATAVDPTPRGVNHASAIAPEEEATLARRAQAGDGVARERLLRSQFRLVVSVARQYENMGLSLLNLIYEGNIGLLKALEHFDPDEGVRFSDCSLPLVKQSMRKALARQSRSLRLQARTTGRRVETE